MPKNRYQIIRDLLASKPFMKIDELCNEIRVSPATIRRDLAQLEKSGSIMRINGGAILRPQNSNQQPGSNTSNDPYMNEKKRIAEAAVSLVKEGDTIFLDAGSTNLEIADLLMAYTKITIVTNSIKIAYKFINRKDLSIIICGGTLGEVNPDSIVGPMAENMISTFRANLSFIGTSGINVKQGITDPYLSAARIKEKMIEHSNHVVLVSDHSKFGVINTYFVCSLEKINHIITDRSLPEDYINNLKSKGITFTLV